jgi:hypothetical protein
VEASDMNKDRKMPWLRMLLTLTVGLLLVAVINPRSPSFATAQSRDDVSAPRSSGYDLSWWTVDGGGYTFSSGGGYTLGGTAGQPDAGVLSGGGYVLGGGFWRGGALEVGYTIYLPVIMRNF